MEGCPLCYDCEAVPAQVTVDGVPLCLGCAARYDRARSFYKDEEGRFT